MKNKMKIKIGVMAVFLSILFVIGCNNPLALPETNVVEGYGNVTINFGDSAFARTLFPEMPGGDYNRYYYRIDYSGDVSKDSDVIESSYVTYYSTQLPLGWWNITVSAIAEIYLDELGYASEYVIASGNSWLNVDTDNNYVSVNIFTGIGSGDGIFNYSGISYPSGMNTAMLRIYNMSRQEVTSVNLLNSNSGYINLASGYYILSLELENYSGKLVKTEILHIYPGLRTYAHGEGYIFTNNDFLTVIPAPTVPYIETLTAQEFYISISWSAAEYAETYEIQYREHNGAFQTFTGITSTNYGFYVPRTNTEYFVRIRARNEIGASSWSGEYSVTTVAGIPGTVDVPTVAAGNAELSVNWNAVPNATSYDVWYRIVSEGGDGQYWVNTTNTNVNISGLGNGIAYQVRIMAINSSGSGNFSGWSTTRTTDMNLPSAPSNVQITNITPSEFTVTWGSVTNVSTYSIWLSTVNNPILSYLQGTVSALEARTMTINSSNANDVTIEPGKIYYVWVRANNQDGPGAYSPTAKFSTTLPTTYITGASPSKERLNVYWNWGEYADAYDIYASLDQWDPPYSDTVPTATVTGTYNNSTAINELTPNLTYYVWIRTKRDNNGEWVYSDWSSTSVSDRVPNNQAVITNFSLNNATETNFVGNQINVTMPYGTSLSSIATYISISTGATSNTSNGTSYSYTSPRTVTVTAEDGETQSVYIVTVKVSTPIQINFEAPADEDIIVTLYDPDAVVYQTRTVRIDMYDSYGDGWNGSGALRINVNGVEIANNVKVQTSAANNTPSGQRNTNTYTFNVVAGDVVQLYWIAGSYQEENSFIIYYEDTPPSPAFNTSNNNSWNGSNALIYRLRGTMNSIGGGASLGSFTAISSFTVGNTVIVDNPLTLPVDSTLELTAPEGYDGYRWVVNNVTAGTSNILVIDGSTLPLGPNSITLIIYKDEGAITVPYSKTINFTVTP